MNPMRLTIEIHDAWLARPEDLRKILTTLAGLEDPPPQKAEGRRLKAESNGAGPDGSAPIQPSAFSPQPSRYPGDDDRSQASDDDDVDEQGRDEDPPTDGRQLLGWCAKQVPDAKGMVIGYGKKRGFPSRVVDWRPDQVAAAYRFARSRPARSRR
jgi:hypothetical protein